MRIDHLRKLAACFVVLASASAQTFTLDPAGSSGSVSSGINPSGAVTGAYADANGNHGFVRDPQGNFTSFTPTGSTGTSPSGINPSGVVTGSYFDVNDAVHGFVRDTQGNIIVFDPTDSIATYAYGINSSGVVAGYYVPSNNGIVHGFVRDPQGNITVFDPTDSVETSVSGINESGAITGWYEDEETLVGFVRDPEGNITSFVVPGTNATLAIGINTSGAVTGYYRVSNQNHVYHGFVRDPQGNITSFDPTGSRRTITSRINASGTITGYYEAADHVYHGFVRDPQGNITSFDPAGSTGTYVSGINTSGAVTGSYYDADGGEHGFVGTVPNGIDISRYTTDPSPIPSSVWNAVRAAGVSDVVVQAWGGKAASPLASVKLQDAQSNGFATGASVLLSYYVKPSAEDQVKKAVEAIGPTAMSKLKIMFVAVEAISGEVFSGIGQNVVDTAQRVGYIESAVSYIQTMYPGVNVGIYSSNGTDQSWTTITGNCGNTGPNACAGLMALPLWDVEHKVFTDGSGAQFCGDGVAGLVPWKPWGPNTWQTRSGNQYYFGSYSPSATGRDADPEAKPANKGCNNPEPFFGLNTVDLDYFDPALFQ
jgi:hypothetical protein